MATVEERIERGMAVLDSYSPAWRSKVNVDTLDLSFPDRCVIGQVFDGLYSDGLALLSEKAEPTERRDWAVNHGFEPTLYVGGAETYGELTEAWSHALAA